MQQRAEYASLPSDSAAPGDARARLRRTCAGTVGVHRLRDLELLISEVVTNAVRYGQGPIELAIECTARDVVVRVRNRGSKRPRLAHPSATDEHGRGLILLDVLSDQWGVDGDQRSTVVWFSLAVGEGVDAAQCP
jgi:anti-sigma regulatory factor (Ser/Thr protein kinase)